MVHNLPKNISSQLQLPVVVAPMFLVSGIDIWKDIWSAGHGVGALKEIQSVAELVKELTKEYLFIKVQNAETQSTMS